MNSVASERGMTAGYVAQLRGAGVSDRDFVSPSAGRDFNFEVPRIVAHIETHGMSRVALQFPDVLLPEAPRIVNEIQAACSSGDVFPFILGDITYGSFEVDHVAAEHLGADLIVHFGPTSSIPANNSTLVLYVFGRQAELSANDVASSFLEAKRVAEDTTSTTVLLYDMQYHDTIGSFHFQFSEALGSEQEVVLGEPDNDFLKGVYASAGDEEPAKTVSAGIDQPENNSDQENKNANGAAESDPQHIFIGGQRVVLPLSQNDGDGPKTVLRKMQGSILFVGPEGPQLTSILMRCPESHVFGYNPLTKMCVLHDMNVNRALMRRYVMMLKAREAKVFGILITTTSSCQVQDMLKAIKHKIRSAGRKFYTVMIGKLNPYKLANFAEVDVFVILSTPEEALVDSKEYHSPIVTPFELSIALDKRFEWDGSYSADFREVLPTLLNEEVGGQGEDLDSDSDGDQPYFSALTGKFISKTDLAFEAPRAQSSARENADSANEQALTLRNQNTEVSTSFYSPAGDFLLSRSFQGLVQGLGQNEAHAAIQGETGIAMAYADDNGLEGRREAQGSNKVSASRKEGECPCSYARSTSQCQAVVTSQVKAALRTEPYSNEVEDVPPSAIVERGRKSISSESDISGGDCEGMSLFADINTDSEED